MTDYIDKSSLEFVVKQTQADAANNEVTLSEPVTTFLNFNKNTRLPALSERDNEVKNAVHLYYNRLDIGVVFLEYEDNQDLVLGGATTTHDLIPIINTKYHVNLTPDDVILETLNPSGEITITIADTSLTWYGTYNFSAAVPLSVIADDNVSPTEIGSGVNEQTTVQDVLRFQWSTHLRTRDNYIVSRRNTFNQEPVIVR